MHANKPASGSVRLNLDPYCANLPTPLLPYLLKSGLQLAQFCGH